MFQGHLKVHPCLGMPKDAEIDNLEMDEMGAMIKIQITGSNFWVMDEMG